MSPWLTHMLAVCAGFAIGFIVCALLSASRESENRSPDGR